MNFQNLKSALSKMQQDVNIIVTYQVEETKIVKLKMVYFSMITELGNFAGYLSRADKEAFKEQIKEELKIESIASITDCDQMRLIIEELHQLGQQHYGYVFKPNDPGIVSFD